MKSAANKCIKAIKTGFYTGRYTLLNTELIKYLKIE